MSGVPEAFCAGRGMGRGRQAGAVPNGGPFRQRRRAYPLVPERQVRHVHSLGPVCVAGGRMERPPRARWVGSRMDYAAVQYSGEGIPGDGTGLAPHPLQRHGMGGPRQASRDEILGDHGQTSRWLRHVPFARQQYNIVDWAGFQRDPLQELSEACAAAGIRFCVYYSHREDWDDPDGYGNNWDYDRSQKNFERYLERKSKPQLRELLTNYGPLGLIWFDRGMDTREHALQFVNLVRTLQPSCLINGRVGGYGEELLGDYQDLNDNGMPTGGLEEYWETPQTLNTTWGYSKFDQQWKSPGNVIQRLVEIVSKGGNYLLNIGPMADGTVPAPSVQTLEKVGPWMRQNGGSIYGTAACPLPHAPAAKRQTAEKWGPGEGENGEELLGASGLPPAGGAGGTGGRPVDALSVLP